MLVIGAAATVLLAFPFVWLLDTKETAFVVLSVVLIYGIGHAGLVGAAPAFFSELFPTNVRYSGLAIGHEVSGMITGVIPLIVSTLVAMTSGASWPLAALLILMCLIGFLAVLWASETHRRSTAKVGGEVVESST